MTALQLWHWTLRRSAFHPRSSSGISRRALTRSSSRIFPVSASNAYGDSVPQNGHTSFFLAGFHSACAPQAGHACFSMAAISDTSVSAKGMPRGPKPPGYCARYASIAARVTR